MMEYEKMTIGQLEELVERKDGEAICELAYRCREGIRGVEKNRTRAFQLYHKGEKMNLPEAYYGLYVMYENGIGVGKNKELAKKYMSLLPSGFETNYEQEEESVIPPQPTPIPMPTPTPDKIDLDCVQKMLLQGEQFRQNDGFSKAREYADKVLAEVIRAKSGNVQIVGNGDLDVIEIEAYWLLCFVSFNEKKYKEMESYFEKTGVMALHPWGAYLCSIVHQMNNASQMTLENDMQRMLDVQDNANLSIEQSGDILCQIADLYLSGVRSNDGDTCTLAYTYYEKAADCGNDYAREQLSRFKKSLTGKVKYIG